MLAPDFLPAWGGPSTYVIELARHLPKNFEIHIVTLLRKGFGNINDKTIKLNNDAVLSRDSVHVHIISKAEDTFFYNAHFQYACSIKVPKLLKKEKIDLIHSNTANMPDLLLQFRALRVPIVTTVHSTIESQREGTKASKGVFWELEKSEKYTYLLYPILKALERIYFLRQRCYVTPSNWMKKEIESRFSIKGKVKVVPNSIDLNDFNGEETKGIEEFFGQKFQDREIILFPSRLLAMKGVNTLIESVPTILRNNHNDPIFFFAGPGDPVRFIEKFKNLGIDDRYYSFLGQLERRELIALMRIAKLVVVPSFMENCPYVILEGMASGVPVISTRIGGIPEIITHDYNGLLINPGSSEELAKYITRVLDDDKMRRDLGRCARQTILKRFSWKANKEKYVDFYEQILECGSNQREPKEFGV